MSEERKLPLEFQDTGKVIRSAADYQRDEANDIRVLIPKNADGFTSLTLFDITLNKVATGDIPVDLLECWIDWSPTDPVDWGAKPQRFGLVKYLSTPFQAIRWLLRFIVRWIYGRQGPQESREVHYPNKLPMIIRDIRVVDPEKAEVKPTLNTNNGKVTLLRATKELSRTMKIKFAVPNVFFSIPGRAPFAKKRLALNIKVLNGASSSVVHLEYPDSIAMRARGDNSEYQSLVLGIGGGYMRKATFFPQQDIRMRYTFGTTDNTELAAPGIPPLRTGLALLGFGFTLLLIHAGQVAEPKPDESLFHLAAVVFALSLIPSVTEMLRIERLFHRSATIGNKPSWERKSTNVCASIHIVAFLLVAWTLLKGLNLVSLVPDFLLNSVLYTRGLLLDLVSLVPGFLLSITSFLFGTAPRFLISIGVFLTFVGVVYSRLLRVGILQGYMCDECEKRMWIRKWYEMRIPRRKDPGNREKQDRLGKWLHRRDLGARVHPETRHSLCIQCYKEISREHLYEPRVPKKRLRRWLQHTYLAITGLLSFCLAALKSFQAPTTQVAYPQPRYESPTSEYTAGRTPGIGATLDEAQEAKAWETVLVAEVGVKPLPEFIDYKVRQNLEDMGLELRYLPCLELDKDKLEKVSVQDYITGLQIRYPNWRTLPQLYWQLIQDGKFSFPKLPGQWVAVETVPNPASALGSKYADTGFGKKLGFGADRFNVSWNAVTEAIERKKQKILSDLGLSHSEVDIRLLEALEWNLLGNREGWGETNTYEWTNTRFCGSSYARFVLVGNSARGGVGGVSVRSPVSTADDLGFRATVVIKDFE